MDLLHQHVKEISEHYSIEMTNKTKAKETLNIDHLGKFTSINDIVADFRSCLLIVADVS